MLSTTIPARIVKLGTGLNFPVTVVTSDDIFNGDDIYGVHTRKVASFAKALRDGVVNDWRHIETDRDGYYRDYRFDGANVTRSGGYHVITDAGAIRAAMGITTDGDDTATGDTATDSGKASKTEQRMWYCRRIIGKAMGFTGTKDHIAAGTPIDRDTIIAAGIKPAKVDVILRDADYGNVPSSTGATVTGIRPGTRDTGRSAHHVSHNK